MLAISSLRRGEWAPAAAVAVRLAVLPLVIGAALAWVAYDGGSYATTTWTSLAIVVWWGILLLVVFDLAPTERLRSATGAVAALLAAYAVLALLSVTWSAGAERAVVAFDRDALYVGVFVFVVFLSSRSTLALWSDGLAFGVAVVAVIALSSRLFPGLFGARGLPESLPTAGLRLSFPLDYWNGLGIFVAIGLPLLLRTASSSVRPLALRSLSVALVPVSVSTLYLTSSRGAGVTAAVAIVFLLVLSRSWSPFGAALAGGLGSVAAVATIHAEHALTGGPIDSAAAESQGKTAALLLAAIVLLTGAAFSGGVRLLARRPTPGRRVAVGLAVAAALIAAGAVVAVHPIRQFHEFKALPAPTGETQIGAHLLSGGGNGRWQFWTAAVDEFRSAPLRGRGAGSYEAWWTQHASFAYFVRDAHSLYLQTLGELGIVGLLLLLTALLTGVALGGRSLRRSQGEERLAMAAVVAASVAFLVGAGVDWMWELPAVTVLGVACLALAAGPASARPRLAPVAGPAGGGRAGSFRGRFGVGVLVLAVTWFVLAAQASSLLSASQLHRSQQLAAGHDLAGALAAADNAYQIAPWSAEPLVQVALVQEEAGHLPDAESAIVRAISHDSSDWRLWLIRARIESEQGRPASARASLGRGRELNPLSPLLRQ